MASQTVDQPTGDRGRVRAGGATAGETSSSTAHRELPGGSGRPSGLGVSRPGYGGVPDVSNPYLESGRRVVILHAWRTAERDTIRGVDPSALLLVYRNLTRAARPVETYTRWGERAATGLTLAEATTGGWASRTRDGDAGVDAVVTLIDRAGYAEAWIEHVLDVVEETAGVGGWDGVFLDDIVPASDGTPDVPAWEPAQAALLATVGPALRLHGLLAVANMCGTWGQYRSVADPLLRYLDGGYDEYFATWPGNPVDREQGYAQAGDSFAAQAACLAQGKLHIAASPVTNGSDVATAEYIFHMALLGTDQSARSSWAAWHGAYDPPPVVPPGLPDAARLGVPLGPATRAGAGWVRRFAEGVVRVNSSRSTATIDGVSLPAFTGAIAWLPSVVVPAPPTGSPGANYYLRATDGALTWIPE